MFVLVFLCMNVVSVCIRRTKLIFVIPITCLSYFPGMLHNNSKIPCEFILYDYKTVEY